MSVWQEGPGGGVRWRRLRWFSSSMGKAAGLEVRLGAARPVMLSGCIAVCELIVLGVVFAVFGLHTGLWALPAFLPLYGWLFLCAAARRTLRPRALSALHGPDRLAAVLVVLVVFCLVWGGWSGVARGAWRAHGGGWSLLGGIEPPASEGFGLGEGAAQPGSLSGFPTGAIVSSLPDPLPSFPFGAVLTADVPLLVLAWVALLVLGMVAMPGRPRVRATLAPGSGVPVDSGPSEERSGEGSASC